MRARELEGGAHPDEVREPVEEADPGIPPPVLPVPDVVVCGAGESIRIRIAWHRFRADREDVVDVRGSQLDVTGVMAGVVAGARAEVHAAGGLDRRTERVVTDAS